MRKLPVENMVGTVLAHDITEIRPGEFKGAAFKKGHVIQGEDLPLLSKLGKEHLFILDNDPDMVHENDAAYALANSLAGDGTHVMGKPLEGKVSILATRDGLLKINKDKLRNLNMLGEVICATLHNNTLVKKGQVLAGAKAIPLLVKKDLLKTAVKIAKDLIQVKKFMRPKAGIVITGNEVFHGRVKDAFAPLITKKIESFGGKVLKVFFTPDKESIIEEKLKYLVKAGANLLIATGGMSVDPDDVTRFAIKKLGTKRITYGSATFPGAMFLVSYLNPGRPDRSSSGTIPVIGIPACAMYAQTTVFDLVLPRILAGEMIGRRELAELGHGGLCMKCEVCRFPVCPFGK